MYRIACTVLLIATVAILIGVACTSPDTTKPKVSIVFPTSSDTLKLAVADSVNVKATDETKLDSVKLLVNGTQNAAVASSDTTFTTKFTYTPAATDTPSVNLAAVAIDAAGNVSDTFKVTVKTKP